MWRWGIALTVTLGLSLTSTAVAAPSDAGGQGPGFERMANQGPLAAPAPLGDWTVGFGAVDPPRRRQLALPATVAQMRRAWGPPSSCEFSSCTSPHTDYAYYDAFKLTVLKGRAVQVVEASGHRWRTAEGIRPRIKRARLRTVHGAQLRAVRNRHHLAGVRFPGTPRSSVIDRTSFYVADGPWAIGFAMVGGRVQSLLAGKTASVTRKLGFYGPL